MNSPFILPNNAFVAFGFQHLFVIFFAFVLGGLVIYFAKTRLNERGQHYVGNAIAWTLVFTVIIWTGVRFWTGTFNPLEDWPFYLCNFMAILMPIFSHTRKEWLYEILVFWVFAGTLQAIITPDLYDGFPHYHFLKYWMIHPGLIIMMVYANQVYGFRPTLRSVGKSWVALQVLFVFFMILNYLMGANYNYLNAKPIVPSILDYLGEWPYYLINGQLIVIPFFLLVYLPFWLTGKKSIEVKKSIVESR